jgi:hypothetical protein
VLTGFGKYLEISRKYLVRTLVCLKYTEVIFAGYIILLGSFGFVYPSWLLWFLSSYNSLLVLNVVKPGAHDAIVVGR